MTMKARIAVKPRYESDTATRTAIPQAMIIPK